MNGIPDHHHRIDDELKNPKWANGASSKEDIRELLILHQNALFEISRLRSLFDEKQKTISALMDSIDEIHAIVVSASYKG